MRSEERAGIRTTGLQERLGVAERKTRKSWNNYQQERAGTRVRGQEERATQLQGLRVGGQEQRARRRTSRNENKRCSR